MTHRLLRFDKASMARNAFTLIEVITALVIVALLASVATPMFLDYRADANRSAERYIVGAVRTAIYNRHTKNAIQGVTTWAITLDSAPAYGQASPTVPFFSTTLDNPVTSGWRKGSTVNTYIGPTNTIYNYDQTNGRFSTTTRSTTYPTTLPTSYPTTLPTAPPPAQPVY